MIAKNAKITKRKFENAREYVFNLLGNLDKSLKFHCFEHTADCVVPAVFELCENKPDEFKYSAAISALFHDTGFVYGYENHEFISSIIASSYMLNSKDRFSTKDIENIESAIRTTNLSANPLFPLEKTVRDADLSYIARDNFREWIRKLQNESKMHPGCFLHPAYLDDKSWIRSSLDFFYNHEWKTDEAKELYDLKKEENLQYLASLL